MTFHSVGNVIIPTDELIFFRGIGIPPTRRMLGLTWNPWEKPTGETYGNLGEAPGVPMNWETGARATPKRSAQRGRVRH